MSFAYAVRIALILSFFTSPSMAHARPLTLRLHSGAEPILNKSNLDKIKQFILKRGQTCTYSNMYNNNPCIETSHFSFYLNPDPGPGNTIQWNIGCDPKKGDFNTMVIHRNLQGEHTDAQFADQYRSIEFKDESKLRLLEHYHSRMSKAAIREFPEQAIKELLAAIKQRE